MNQHRETNAIHIIRESCMKSRSTPNQHTPTIVITPLEVDASLPPLRQAVYNWFRALGQRFPLHELHVMLAQSSLKRQESNRGGNVPANRLTRDTNETSSPKNEEDLLSKWLKEKDPSLIALIALLEQIVIAGFMTALRLWLQAYHLPTKSLPPATSDGQLLAAQSALELLAATRKKLLALVAEKLNAAREKQDTLEQALQELAAYLQNDSVLQDRATQTAGSLLDKAFHTGAFQLNEQLACSRKQWRIADYNACGQCMDYAAKGFQHLEYEYAPGILMPPAHPHCRCHMVYHGISDILLKA